MFRHEDGRRGITGFDWFVVWAVAFQLIVFSAYASCVPISDAQKFREPFCRFDDWRYVKARILVVFGWTALAALCNVGRTGRGTLRVFIAGAAPALVYAVCGLFDFASTWHIDANFYGQYLSSYLFGLAWMRGGLVWVMRGVSYGIVGGLFARRVRSIVLAFVIGLVALVGQGALDFVLAVHGYYGLLEFHMH